MGYYRFDNANEERRICHDTRGRCMYFAFRGLQAPASVDGAHDFLSMVEEERRAAGPQLNSLATELAKAKREKTTRSGCDGDPVWRARPSPGPPLSPRSPLTSGAANWRVCRVD